MILINNLISSICIAYLIFIPWKKGPEWYLKFSDKLFFSMLLLNYIILPLMNNIAFVISLSSSTKIRLHAIGVYIVFFNVVCFMRLIEYFVIVRRTVLLDAKTYLIEK